MTRATMLSLSALLFGIALMADTATLDAQEKKAPNPERDESYNEKVSVRRFESGKLSKNAAPNIPAFRFEVKDELKFWTKAKGGATPTVGTEITDEKGNVYTVKVVKEFPASGFHVSTVKAKPKE